MRLLFLLVLFSFMLTSCGSAQKGMYSSKSKKAIKFYESARTCFNALDPLTGIPALDCAEEYVLKALTKDSLFTEAYSLASNISIERGDIEKAILYREKMISYSSKVPAVEYFYLASMYMATG